MNIEQNFNCKDKDIEKNNNKINIQKILNKSE